jgi:hypothetical protein
MAIDADPTNGSAPCSPIDAARTVNTGVTYTVGICVTGTGGVAPNAFTAVLVYDGNLNSASTITCSAPCLDANPNANDGNSTDGSLLGSGWVCFGGLVITPPVGDDPATAGVADANINCLADVSSPDTDLTDDPGLLASVTFTATSGGVENLTLSGASNVFGENCGIGITCAGATITKSGAVVNTPTPSQTAGPTSTPCVGSGCNESFDTVTPSATPAVPGAETPTTAPPATAGTPAPTGVPAGGGTAPGGITLPDTGIPERQDGSLWVDDNMTRILALVVGAITMFAGSIALRARLRR